MPVSIRELEEFQSRPNYARFVHTNLHLHTPSTPWDWDSYANQSRKAVSLTPHDYFDALNKTSLELVAITDHNCVSLSWCKPLIDLARKARNEGQSKLHVLPGVEITTYEGPHLVAIFDENQDMDEIRTMLVRLGMSGEGSKDDRVGLKSTNEITIPQVLAEVVRLGGVAIGPHVHQKDGLWGPKEFRGRSSVLNDKRLRILAAPSGEIKRVVESSNRVRLLYKNMDSNQITNSFGFINVSDCHRVEDFELNTTWISMTTPSLNGIRQVIYEPELRVAHTVIRTDEPVEYPETIHFSVPAKARHPYIMGVSIVGGMLNGQKIALSPNQNCIIGKNYAGKSALLDCIRFSVNAVPNEPNAHHKFADRMRAFVGEGGEVRIYLQDLHGKVYGISRTLTCTSTGRGPNTKLQIEGLPEISLLWNDEFKLESDLTIDQILHLEVYPQGEVVKIKDNAAQQMNIVDALAKVEIHLQQLTTDEVNGERTIRGKLADNSQRIISSTERQNELHLETSGIGRLEAEIEDLEKMTKSPLYVQKKRWADAEVTIDSYSKELRRLADSWSSNNLTPTLRAQAAQVDSSAEKTAAGVAGAFNPDGASYDEYATHASGIFVSATAELDQNLTNARKVLASAVQTLTELETACKSREDQLEVEIRRNLPADDLGTEEGGLIDRITEKRRRLNDLQQKQRDEATLEAEIESLAEERVELLALFHSKWVQIRNARYEVVKLIDSESASNIRAALTENTDRVQYRQLLNEIAERLTSSANKIQNKEAQLDAIAASSTPTQLIDIVKQGNAGRLSEIEPEVTLNTARIILGMGQADIHRLEECLLRDSFVIAYKKAGDTEFTPIDSALSGGEQALALISVAMVPKQVPLIIDQPEDELGPALITNELVEQIRGVKSVRQLIFVTHIPNIPVLADSEQVVYIEQEFNNAIKKSVIGCCGSLDQVDIVEHLLELDGGRIAFQKRGERYSSVMERVD